MTVRSGSSLWTRPDRTVEDTMQLSRAIRSNTYSSNNSSFAHQFINVVCGIIYIYNRQLSQRFQDKFELPSYLSDFSTLYRINTGIQESRVVDLCIPHLIHHR